MLFIQKHIPSVAKSGWESALSRLDALIFDVILSLSHSSSRADTPDITAGLTDHFIYVFNLFT